MDRNASTIFEICKHFLAGLTDSISSHLNVYLSPTFVTDFTDDGARIGTLTAAVLCLQARKSVNSGQKEHRIYLWIQHPVALDHKM